MFTYHAYGCVDTGSNAPRLMPVEVPLTVIAEVNTFKLPVKQGFVRTCSECKDLAPWPK
jgi:hypothetical protein